MVESSHHQWFQSDCFIFFIFSLHTVNWYWLWSKIETNVASIEITTRKSAQIFQKVCAPLPYQFLIMKKVTTDNCKIQFCHLFIDYQFQRLKVCQVRLRSKHIDDICLTIFVFTLRLHAIRKYAMQPMQKA